MPCLGLLERAVSLNGSGEDRAIGASGATIPAAMPPHVTDRWRDFLGPGAIPSFVVAALLALLGLGLPILWRLRRVLEASRQVDEADADAILVLGRSLVDDRPTEVFRARLDQGAELWRSGRAPRIIVAGGLTGRSTITEAEAGRRYLVDWGVDPQAVLCEGESRHTLENLVNVRETLRSEDWSRLLIVSDPLHQARVLALARGLGMNCGFAPAREAGRKGFLRWLRALREACLLHWYHSGVAYSRLIGNERYLSRVT